MVYALASRYLGNTMAVNAASSLNLGDPGNIIVAQKEVMFPPKRIVEATVCFAKELDPTDALTGAHLIMCDVMERIADGRMTNISGWQLVNREMPDEITSVDANDVRTLARETLSRLSKESISKHWSPRLSVYGPPLPQPLADTAKKRSAHEMVVCTERIKMIMCDIHAAKIEIETPRNEDETAFFTFAGLKEYLGL